MYISSLLVVVGSGVLASAAERSSYAPLSLGLKRDLMTCEQTYGAGSVACGNSDSTMCYNPSQGQSCCGTDHGYCDKGLSCAPVAGYCCEEGQDVSACAQDAGFTLPASLAASAAASVATSEAALSEAASSAAASVVTSMVSLYVTGSASPTADATAAATSSKPALATPTKGSNSTSGPPHVQVSVARKEQWTLVYMTLGIGVVGLIMATF